MGGFVLVFRSRQRRGGEKSYMLVEAWFGAVRLHFFGVLDGCDRQAKSIAVRGYHFGASLALGSLAKKPKLHSRNHCCQ